MKVHLAVDVEQMAGDQARPLAVVDALRVHMRHLPFVAGGGTYEVQDVTLDVVDVDNSIHPGGAAWVGPAREDDVPPPADPGGLWHAIQATLALTSDDAEVVVAVRQLLSVWAPPDG